MKIRTKLVVLMLVISLVPVSVVGVAGLKNMEDLGTFAQDESTERLERQVTGELNTTVESRQKQFQNLLNVRRLDARSLADSAPVKNYEAAKAGEMERLREQNQEQVGTIALQMHDSVETAKQTILESQYEGRSWEELSAEEQAQVKDEVERQIAGTAGNQTFSNGTVSRTFQPGYIGDSGYAYVVDSDSRVVIHHALPDGHDLVEDSSLTVFEDVHSDIDSSPSIRNGEDWGIAEYEYNDTTQEGNPLEEKFIAYTYHEDFDWVLAPSVYYYELQTDAVEDAEQGINDSFGNYLNTRTISVHGDEVPAYDEIILTDKAGQGILQANRTASGNVSTHSVDDVSYADTEWFDESKTLDKGEIHVSNVHFVDGRQVIHVASPVYHNGEFAGTVVLRFNFSTITALTNNVTVGRTGHLTIVNDDGRILSHPDLSVVKNEERITDERYAGSLAGIAQDRILAGQTGLDTYARTDDGGNETGYYVAYTPLEFGGREFALLATVPNRDVQASAIALGEDLSDRTTSARNFLLLLIGGLIAAVVGIGFKSASYFSTPIEQVRDQATALAEGRFDEETDIDSTDDEIGELVDAFGEMQENLRRQVDELREVSRNLGEGTLDQEVRTDLPGEFGAIMSDIDDGIQKLQVGFTEIRDTSQRIKVGELDQNVDTDLPGEYGDVLADLESGVDQLDTSFDEISEASRQLRDGQLEQTIETDLPGQYGKVMEDLETGVDEIERSLAEVKDLADRFAELSTQTATSAEEIESASQETAESVEEIAHGAESQTEQLQAAASEMNDLSATIEEVASSADAVVDTANEAATLSDRGREHAADATEEISAIESEADAAVEQVESLETQITEINDIVGLITDIAEQTNLLALNASIEAARAGEAGEGFAVVADEIKTLAGEASAATDDVEELIGEIQASADDTVGDMRSMQNRVETGSQTIEDAIEMFDDIAEAVENAEHGVGEISDAAEDQAVSTEEVVAMVDEVSSVSQQTAAEASTVSSATQQQTAAINEVSHNVQAVSDSAQTLTELVNQFEVGERDDSDDRPVESDSEGQSVSPVADGGKPEGRDTDA